MTRISSQMCSVVRTLDDPPELHSGPTEKSVLVSVLIPLEEDRNSAERSIRSWCQEQTLDRDRYEVIAIASSTTDERRLTRIRALLGPGDKLVRSTFAHDVAQVAEAAALAQGELLFFSESHVWPSPDVLERSLTQMELHPDWAGLTCGSRRVVLNRVGSAEADMYERDFEIGWKQLGWRNILDQCFLTRRVSYFAAGGFDVTLGHFAEWVLAARYKTEGLVVGHCPDIALWHVFSGDIRELAPFTQDFVRGEITYLARDPATRREALVEAPIEWSCRGDRRHDLARHIVQLIAGEALRALKEGGNARVSWRLALKRLPVMFAGSRPAATVAALRLLASRLELIAARFGTDRAVALAFERCMAAIIRQARLRWADRFLAGPRRLDTGELWSAYSDRAHLAAGLHDWEHVEDVPFRWSEPAAVIALGLPPGCYCIHVNTLRKQLANRPRHQPEFFLNGQRIANVRTGNDGNALTFLVDLHSANNWLGWICPPTSAPGDSRLLGIPLVSVVATVGHPDDLGADELTNAMHLVPWTAEETMNETHGSRRAGEGGNNGPASTESADAGLHGAARNLRRALDDTSARAIRSDERAHAEEMSRALAERDRQAAELTRQADERLALIEQVTRDAEDRLTALEQTTAAAQALREELARVSEHLAAVFAENEQLRRVAQERLDLLEANERAYAEFKELLRTGQIDPTRIAD